MDINELDKAAYNRKKPENLDFLDLRLYWTLRAIYFLFEQGELDRTAAAQAKKDLLEQYAPLRKRFSDWQRGQEAYRLMQASSNAECRRIAKEMEGMFT